MACVLRAPQQVTCSTDVRAAQQHPSAAPQPPSQLEKKQSPADNAHIIVYCMLVYTTRTCINDIHAARRQRSSPARAQRCGQCLPGGAATLLPKSSPPVRDEGVVVAKTCRAAAPAQRRRSTSENRFNQHETQTKTQSCKRVHPAQTSRNDDHASVTYQRPSPSATPSFNNLMMPWMRLRCSGPVQAQRLLALRRHVTHLMMGSDMSGNCE